MPPRAERRGAEFERRNPVADPEWFQYFDEAELSAELGHCFRDLGGHAAAHRPITVSGASSCGPRSDFFVTMVLAEARLGARRIPRKPARPCWTPCVRVISSNPPAAPATSRVLPGQARAEAARPSGSSTSRPPPPAMASRRRMTLGVGGQNGAQSRLLPPDPQRRIRFGTPRPLIVGDFLAIHAPSGLAESRSTG